jgi:hypothetical protein
MEKYFYTYIYHIVKTHNDYQIFLGTIYQNEKKYQMTQK